MTNASDGPYFLACNTFGKPFRLPISRRRFVALNQAWSNLKHIAHVEEEWDAVVQNYVELEKAHLETALRDMVVSELNYFSFQETRLKFAVRLANVLSSCRAYLDHTPHHLGLIAPKQPYADEFRTLTHTEYDKRFGYRFMEGLRNYAQHRGLPIHGTKYNSAWVEGGESGLLSHSVSSHISLDILRKDKTFKQSIIKGRTENSLQAEPLVRDYLEGLSTVHMRMREVITAPFESASQMVRSALADYAAASSKEDVVGLHAIQLEPPHTWVKQIPLFEELMQVTEKLRRRNRPMTNLKKRFVTSSTEATKRKQS